MVLILTDQELFNIFIGVIFAFTVLNSFLLFMLYKLELKWIKKDISKIENCLIKNGSKDFY